MKSKREQPAWLDVIMLPHPGVACTSTAFNQRAARPETDQGAVGVYKGENNRGSQVPVRGKDRRQQGRGQVGCWERGVRCGYPQDPGLRHWHQLHPPGQIHLLPVCKNSFTRTQPAPSFMYCIQPFSCYNSRVVITDPVRPAKSEMLTPWHFIEVCPALVWGGGHSRGREEIQELGGGVSHHPQILKSRE